MRNSDALLAFVFYFTQGTKITFLCLVDPVGPPPWAVSSGSRADEDGGSAGEY